MRSPTIVIDAGVAVHLVVQTQLSASAEKLWYRIGEQQARVCAPRLFSFEVTSVIHRYRFDGLLTHQQEEEAMATVLDLGVELVNEDLLLCRSAIAWADRLQQRAAYDGFYVAVTEREHGELWTTDRRLVNGLRSVNGPPARWIGEIS